METNPVLQAASGQIISPAEFVPLAQKLKAEGKVLAQFDGVFDFVQTVGVNFFARFKPQADIIYVVIVADEFVRKGPGHPIFNQEMRASWVAKQEGVDYVIINPALGPFDILKAVQPDFLIKGESYRHSPPKGHEVSREIVESYGGTVVYAENDKIVSMDSLAQIAALYRQRGETVALCHGVFDLLHLGHMRHFEVARSQADHLVVTLTPDRYVEKGVGRPFWTEHHRAEAVAMQACVDYVAVNHWRTAVETISSLLGPGDVFCKGEEFAQGKDDVTQIGAIFVEEQAAKEKGARLFCTPTGLSHISSSEILNAHFPVFPEPTRDFLSGFRKQFGVEEILSWLDRLRSQRVLCLGEAFFDQYIFARQLGPSMSQALINIQTLREDRFEGGVIAAAHLAATFVQQADFVSIIGHQDDAGTTTLRRIGESGSGLFFADSNHGTLRRTWYLDNHNNQKLIETMTARVPCAVGAETEQQILAKLDATLASYDAVLLLDAGMGTLTPNIRALASQKARFVGVITTTHGLNTGFNLVTAYSRADIACVAESDLRLAAHQQYGEVESLSEQVAGQIKARYLNVLCENEGVIARRANGTYLAIPPFYQTIIDATGANEAHFVLAALLAASGAPPEVVGFLGNVITAMAITTLGTQKAAEHLTVRKFVKTLLK